MDNMPTWKTSNKSVYMEGDSNSVTINRLMLLVRAPGWCEEAGQRQKVTKSYELRLMNNKTC